MSIKIVTDSTAELTREEIEQYAITVIPIQYSLNGKVYTDHGDLSPTVTKNGEFTGITQNVPTLFGDFSRVFQTTDR